MLFRQAGIFHTDYAADRALFPIPADRWMIGILLVLALTAPLYMDSLHLSSYMLPWLVWTAGALGLNLILGWAGQFHLGYAAVMGIGAYAAVHAMKAGIPWELAIILAGLFPFLGQAYFPRTDPGQFHPAEGEPLRLRLGEFLIQRNSGVEVGDEDARQDHADVGHASRNGFAAAVMPLRDRSADLAVRWPGDGLIQWPVRPSIDSRRRSAWPLWRAYSWIMAE